ncbi:hypothetical protein HYFRA_00006360 [Hymenoscyphus fraxineus]|uniref:Uncharacterized protein n=1 Tax=Hymenoscyphus fraxineus TaxID=746836 RepID=A0A9N9PPU5_9HELO|nr:hypothetical protein HYFRA_00006360 [Hymenoscyphus fraxineus]
MQLEPPTYWSSEATLMNVGNAVIGAFGILYVSINAICFTRGNAKFEVEKTPSRMMRKYANEKAHGLWHFGAPHQCEHENGHLIMWQNPGFMLTPNEL